MKPVLKNFPVVALAPGMKVLVSEQTSPEDAEIFEFTVKSVETNGHSVIVFYEERPGEMFWHLDREQVKMMALEDTQ